MIILEQYGELELLLRASASLSVEPVIGIRARLTTQHAGHWGTTSGDRAKFGLLPSEIVAVVDRLLHDGMLECLNLLHFHAGSQVHTSGCRAIASPCFVTICLRYAQDPATGLTSETHPEIFPSRRGSLPYKLALQDPFLCLTQLKMRVCKLPLELIPRADH